MKLVLLVVGDGWQSVVQLVPGFDQTQVGGHGHAIAQGVVGDFRDPPNVLLPLQKGGQHFPVLLVRGAAPEGE